MHVAHTLNHARASHSFAEQRQWRFSIVILFILCTAIIIIARLAVLQVARHGDYQALARGQHETLEELVPQRGTIYAQNKDTRYPLAINRAYSMAYAVPRDVTDSEKTVIILTSVLGLDEQVVREKISKPDDLFEILKHRLSPEEERRLTESNLDGIHLSPEYFRYYPGGELAAQVVGFVGSDGQEYRGRYGMEASFENTLHGQKGVLQQERAAGGGWISIGDRLLMPAQDGPDILLTINYPVQYEVERILRAAVETHRADSGSAVVLSPQDGKIIAMASVPSFNPNNYNTVEDIARFVNPIVSHAYEPGSVFKPITMAIGIDHGVVTPDTTYVDTGQVVEAGYTITNAEGKVYGKSTMTNVLEESINTGVIHVEKLLGNTVFADYVRQFGFGEKTGIALPGESPGNMRNLAETKRDIQFFTASFGQGISVTPLQLAVAYGALANGGVLMTPQIVEKMTYADGREDSIAPQQRQRVIREETARTMGEMLRNVVVNGHGKRADVPGYRVGGKTGTAQVAKSDAKGYDDGATIGTFAGYAPLDDPRFVVVVKIDNPKDVIWAESSAAPTFGKIMRYLLQYYDVPPTEPYDGPQS